MHDFDTRSHAIWHERTLFWHLSTFDVLAFTRSFRAKAS